MSEIRALLKQSSHYLAGHIAIMAAGIVSFPILTRIFSVGDYGVLGLLSTTLFIMMGITKLGMPSAIVRFYGEFKVKDKLAEFYSSIFYGILFLSVFLGLSFFLVSQQLVKGQFGHLSHSMLLLLAFLMIVGSMNDTLTSFLRAEQKTKYYNWIAVVRRYGAIGLGIFLVFQFEQGIWGYLTGQFMAWAAILIILFWGAKNRSLLNINNFSGGVFRESVRFGIPLVIAEVGHLFLNYMDRYLIQIYLGANSLGLYTAGHNLATHITEAIIYPINYAMTPIYMKILVSRGEEETKRFFTKLFKYFLLVLIPAVFGVIAIGEDLIVLLSSSRYRESFTIIPYIIVGQSIYACTIILNSGLFIRKKTYILSYLLLSACLFNVVLNLVLIPKYGLIGAGIASVLANIIYASAITYFSFREFSFPIKIGKIGYALAIGWLMFIVIGEINIGNKLGTLLSRILCGGLLYGILIIVADNEIRGHFSKLRKNILSGRAS